MGSAAEVHSSGTRTRPSAHTAVGHLGCSNSPGTTDSTGRHAGSRGALLTRARAPSTDRGPRLCAHTEQECPCSPQHLCPRKGTSFLAWGLRATCENVESAQVSLRLQFTDGHFTLEIITGHVCWLGFPDSSVEMQETPENLVRFLGQKIRRRRPTPEFLGLPGGSARKESTCNAGDLGSIPGLGRSPRER